MRKNWAEWASEYRKPEKSGHQMAAEKNPFPRRWYGVTVFTNLKVVWAIPVWFTLTLAVLVLAWTARDAEAGEDCADKASLVDRLLCYGAEAKAQNDLAVCDRAAHLGVRYQCYYIFAQHTDDLEVCNRIPDADLKDGCVSDIAALRTDPELCTGIAGPGIKDSCYFKIAKALGERGLCNQIDDEGLRGGCLAE